MARGRKTWREGKNTTPRLHAKTGRFNVKEPLIYCDSGMQDKASRSETRSLS